MARLLYVLRDEAEIEIGRRQIPVIAGDNLMMIMDMNSKGLVIDSPQIRGKDLEEFTRKFNLLNSEERRISLEIDVATFNSVLNQCVQCVGCRRKVERLFQTLTISGNPTLDPLVFKNTCILTISEEKLKTPQALGTLLYRHHEVLNNLLENKLRNKTRCLLHSLDAFRTKPFSEAWRDVWSAMKHTCRDELAVIDTKELHDVLETYLKKHKFCQGCRTKIEKAYKLLVGESTSKEKGFVAALYANIKKCHSDKHIHVHTNKIDFLDALIRRAEPEVNGSSYTKQRERHAKTLEIAQEEVLTCVGMIMYERLRRLYINLREEERACQVLAAVGVHALCRSFDMFVEKKQGISNLELLYKQISRAEKAKELKREQKKLKKKMKKNEKKNSHRVCEKNAVDTGSDTAEADEEPDEAVDVGDDDDEDEADVEVEVEVEMELVLKEPEEEEMSNTLSTPALVGDLSVASKKKKKKPKQKQLPQVLKNSKKKTASAQKQQQKDKKPNTRSSSCTGSSISNTAQEKNIVVNSKSGNCSNTTKTAVTHQCNDCMAPTPNCPCDVKDSGYGSEVNSSSPNISCSSSSEGSEISCSDGFCNHAHGTDELEEEQFQQHNCEPEICDMHYCHRRVLSLQQMLKASKDAEEDEVNCYIPPEVVLEYQSDKVQLQRQQLRETLRQNFARLCKQGRGGFKSLNAPSPINC